METQVLHYDDTPPSLNKLSGHHYHGKYPAAKSRWEGILAMMFLAGKVPRGLSRVKVTAALRFPDKRRRDSGNHRFMLEKAMGDALVKGGWLEDDDHHHFEFGALTFEDERGPKRTTLTVEYE